MSNPERITSLKDFWPFYLTEHSDRINRNLHAIGSTLVLAILGYAIFTANFWLLLVLPICGYGFAWFGHFVFEKNKPATFKYPLYSFVSDWIMLYYVLTLQADKELARCQAIMQAQQVVKKSA